MPAEQPGCGVGCADARSALAAMVDASAPVAPPVAAHVGTCLRCQAELARYRRLLRDLRSLRGDLMDPAPVLVRQAIGAVQAERDKSSRRVLVAYVGGAVVATAASAAGMLVWATRRRVPLAS